MSKRWRIKEPNIAQQLVLCREFDILPLTAQVLINRGIVDSKQVKSFLKSDLNDLTDPLKLPDIDVAIRRINKAIEDKENILIFGDYDVDGVTSCVLMSSVLKELGARCKQYIPHRIKEGYGLNEKIVEYCKKNKIDLVITVDCGTTDFEEIEQLSKAKIDVIVIDHHEPLARDLKGIEAFVNPKRHDSSYPYKDLAAVGLVFKVAQAISKRPLTEYLDLVALGTVADVAPLNGENRILVKFGLSRIKDTKREGLKALIQAAGIEGKDILPEYISFILGPRINASGRMDSAHSSLELLLSEEELHAKRLAKDLNQSNQLRQRVEGEILDEAINYVETELNFKDHNVITIGKEGWHAGVLGIVASKIADKYNRPAIIVSFDNDIGKGSCRSIENFHILDALAKCQDYLVGFGGHCYAAGLTINKKYFDSFRDHINQIASAVLKPEDFLPTLEIDSLVNLEELSLDLINEIENLAPFGEANKRPIFCSKNLKIKSPPKRLGRDTLKLWVSDDKFTYQAIGFRMAKFYDLVSNVDTIDLAYRLSFDRYNGEENMQLDIQDIRVSS